jgi:hypothetical protein
MSNSTLQPEPESPAPKAIDPAMEDLKRAVAAIAPLGGSRRPSSPTPFLLPTLHATLTALLLVLAVLMYWQLWRVSEDVKRIDAEAMNQASSNVSSAVEKFLEVPGRLESLGQPQELGWLKNLPATVDQAQKKLQTELMPTQEETHRSLTKLTETASTELPKLKHDLTELNSLLAPATAREAEAANRLSTTLRETKNMLAHIRYIAQGDTQPVRIALVCQDHAPAAFMEAVNEHEPRWKSFGASHPEWKIESGVIVNGKFQRWQDYGELREKQPAFLDRFRPDDRFRLVLLVEAGVPPPPNEFAPVTDAVLVLDRGKIRKDFLGNYEAWSKFCRKNGGQATLAICEYEDSSQLDSASVQYVGDLLFRAAAPRWPLVKETPTPNEAKPQEVSAP